MGSRSDEVENPSARARSRWPRRSLLLAAVALPLPLLAVLIFFPSPEETVTPANFDAIRLGMSQSELRKLLGPPRFDSVELGLVNGPASYTVNFALTEDELLARGFQEYLRQVWISPQITMTVVSDADQRVVCTYSGGGQSRDWHGWLRHTTTQRMPFRRGDQQ